MSSTSSVSSNNLNQQPLIHQGVHLVGSTIDYAKGVVGLGSAKPAQSLNDAAHNPQGDKGSQTLGGLINESRDLAANILGAVKDVIAVPVQKAAEVADDAQASVQQQRPVGVVGKVRNLAGSIIGVAQNIIASGAQTIDENTPNSAPSTGDIKNGANQAVAEVSRSAADLKRTGDKALSQAQASAANTANSAAATAKGAINSASKIAAQAQHS